MIKLNYAKLSKDIKLEDGIYYTPYSGGCGYHIVKEGKLFKNVYIAGCFEAIKTTNEVLTIFNNN